MADSDQSLTNLRYNQISGNLEAFGGGTPQWTSLTLKNVDPTQVPITRLISTTAPITGGGDLSTNRTLAMAASTNSVDGYLTAADHTTFAAALPAASFSDAGVTGKLLTGYSSGAGTVAGTDTILQGINKLNGNDALKLPLAGGTVTGTVTFDKPPAYLVLDRSHLDSPIILDARLTINVDVNVDDDLTINGPTDGFEMQRITFQLREAGHAVTFATGAGNFLFTTTFPSFTASASGTDYVEAIWNPDANNWVIINIVKA